jgi:hypothetical protein
LVGTAIPATAAVATEAFKKLLRDGKPGTSLILIPSRLPRAAFEFANSVMGGVNLTLAIYRHRPAISSVKSD